MQHRPQPAQSNLAQSLSRACSSLPFRLALVSFLFNFSVQSSLIFLPLYADSLGASRLQIGFIAAAYGMAYFVSSFLFGRQSDIHGRLMFVRYGLLLAASTYILQVFVSTPLALLAARGLIGFCLGIASAALMAYVYEAGARVGSFASYGSLGWLFGSLGAAAIRDYESLFILSSAAAATAFLLSLTLREVNHTHLKVAAFPARIMWSNRRIYLAFLLRHAGATSIWAIFPLYLASIGASLAWIAILNSINMAGQFVTMRIVQRYNPSLIFVAGFLISTIVFASYGLANNYLQLIPVQALLAVSWSFIFVGALLSLLGRNVERGTAVGLLYSTNYLASGIGPFLGGAISQVWGFDVVMYAASGLAFAGLFISRGLREVSEAPTAQTGTLPDLSKPPG